MKVIQIVGLGVGLAFGGAALADDSAPALDAKTLGVAEAMVGYCQKADPADAGKYAELVKQIVKGQSDKVIAAVRQSDAYRQAYDSMSDFASKVDEHNAKTTCSKSLAQSK
jgi:hypothetical protein